jgi:hypothetical protein
VFEGAVADDVRVLSALEKRYALPNIPQSQHMSSLLGCQETLEIQYQRRTTDKVNSVWRMYALKILGERNLVLSLGE